ncbi:MAG: tetratricopeptide repeat protein [Enhygromyxa sp.]
MRTLSKAPPWARAPTGQILEVCLHAPDLLDLPRDSRVLVRVRVEELEWLNVNRPVFSDRSLRAVLWLDEAAHRELSRRAVDVYDWVSRLVGIPDKPVPDFAVEGMQAALALGIGIVWRGEDLQRALAATGCSGGTVELDAGDLHSDLIARLREPGLPVVEGIRSEADAWRIRMALAHVGREGSWVAREPAVELPGMAVVHDRQADWDDAARRLAEAGRARPELLAAWLDLEPERIEAACERDGPPDAGRFDVEDLATGRAPTWALRGAAIEQLQRVRSRISALTDAPEDPAALVCWADGHGAWRPTAAQIRRLTLAIAEARDAASRKHFAAFGHGQYDEAEESFRESIRVQENVFGTRQHPTVAASLHGLANVLSSQGKFEEAERALRESLDIKPHHDVAAALRDLARILARQGKFEDAKRIEAELASLRESKATRSPTT